MAEELKETSLRDDIIAAVAEVKAPEEEITKVEPEAAQDEGVAPKEGRDEKGRFKGKEAPTEGVIQPVEIAKPVIEEPPQALSAAVKAKWAELPSEVRQEISKRESDVHKMFTSQDGELRIGREMKEVITPYMAMIQSEGGTPVAAVQSLLNTAYQLRTGTPQQKTQLLLQVAQQYGVDLSGAQPEYQDPTIQALQQKIAQLEQMANPDILQRKMEEKFESNRILSEVNTFASDTANKYYEQVKPLMASLLGSGTAQNMKEAYDLACNAHPQVRSILEAEKSASLKVKQAEEIAAKRKASASITGSPGATVPNSGAPNRTLREEIAANIRAATSS